MWRAPSESRRSTSQPWYVVHSGPERMRSQPRTGLAPQRVAPEAAAACPSEKMRLSDTDSTSLPKLPSVTSILKSLDAATCAGVTLGAWSAAAELRQTCSVRVAPTAIVPVTLTVSTTKASEPSCGQVDSWSCCVGRTVVPSASRTWTLAPAGTSPIARHTPNRNQASTAGTPV